MALTYDILGSELRTPVLIVVIVSTVVIPEEENLFLYEQIMSGCIERLPKATRALVAS
jgi:hypothetical protein